MLRLESELNVGMKCVTEGSRQLLLGDYKLMRCFNCSIFTSIFLSLLFSTSAMALAPNPSCDAETACPDGWSCQLMACDAIACDPDDENCDSNCFNEGMCVANPKP